MEIFILGSCRVWSSAQKNKWVDMKKDVVQSHYLDEIIQYVKWFISREKLKEYELKTFRHKLSDEQFTDHKKSFEKAGLFLVEISSVKTSKSGEVYSNLLNHNNKNTNVSTMEELKPKIKELIDLLGGRPVIFFPHVNPYSEKLGGFLEPRIITQSICNYARKKFGANVINPTKFLYKYGSDKCLDGDFNHFSDFMIGLISKEIVEVVASKFGIYIQICH